MLVSGGDTHTTHLYTSLHTLHTHKHCKALYIYLHTLTYTIHIISNCIVKCIMHHPMHTHTHARTHAHTGKGLCYCSFLGLMLYTLPYINLFEVQSLPRTSIYLDINSPIVSISSPPIWWYTPTLATCINFKMAKCSVCP